MLTCFLSDSLTFLHPLRSIRAQLGRGPGLYRKRHLHFSLEKCNCTNNMQKKIPVQCHRKLVMQLFSGFTKSNAAVRACKTTCLCSAVRFGDRPNFLCSPFFFATKQRSYGHPSPYITPAAKMMSSF